MTSMAQTVTVASLNSNRKFPFVRVPMVELPGSSTRSFSGVEIITWSPLVGEAERGEWSDFVKAELPLWYEQSKKLLPYITSDSHDDQQEFEEETSVNSTRTRDFIWRGDRNLDGIIEVSPVGQTFAPIWQCSPPPFSTTFINYDMMDISHVASMQSSIQELRQGLMSAVDPALMGIPDSFSKEGAFHTAFHDEYSSEVSEDGQVHPHSIFIQPVYDGLDTAKSSFAGFLVAQVAWDFFFANLLPIGVSGIFAVLSNTCSQSYTYVLDGRKVCILFSDVGTQIYHLF